MVAPCLAMGAGGTLNDRSVTPGARRTMAHVALWYTPAGPRPSPGQTATDR